MHIIARRFPKRNSSDKIVVVLTCFTSSKGTRYPDNFNNINTTTYRILVNLSMRIYPS